jgi:amidase
MLPMPVTDLSTAGARRLVQALADREVGALELCNAAIDRIEAGDHDIHAVVVRDFDRAREQARAADAAIARGERRPLLGVPMTVKESFNVAGLRTTWGFEFARDLPPATEDAVAVARLKAAGAVLLGKTNCALALADWQTANPVYGRTAHPLDLSRTPGGSSGGSAAALAAGFVPLELGSDLVGSIRVPAHFCGLAGHKPSHGLCPKRGHDFPGAPYGSHDDPIAVIGPMAREVGDLVLALEVLAGPENDAAVAYRLSLPPPRQDGVAGLRVLVLDRHPQAAVSDAVRAAVHQAAERLASAGARVRHETPLLPDPGRLVESYGAMVTAFVTRGQPGPVISAHAWMELLDEQARVRRRCRELFETVDVVLCPPFGTTAYEHQDDKQVLRIDGRDTPYDAQGAWASLASFAGLPATVVPVARTGQGLPIGVQIVGPYLHDRTTLAVAEWLHAER